MDRTPLASHRSLLWRLTGTGLLVASGAVHLDLYLTGYRSIPTIGWLFLLQVVVALALAAGVVAIDSRLVAAAGAGFAVATLGGYLLSVAVGLFGFKEVRTTAGVVAGVIEVAAFAVLASVAVVAPRRALATSPPAAPSPAGRPRTGARPLEWSIAGVSLVALAFLGAVVGSAGGAVSSAAGGGPLELRARQIGHALVLTNAKGFTLYWFALDTPTESHCSGSCSAYWPPVTGTPTGGRGVTGTLGTIRRPDGSLQATYDRRPLYTYVGDSAPGQANGNGVNLNGGLWHEVTISGGTG